ncbi:MAG: cytidylate kinase-like family protein [Deltaproteobacteria bacterium]|nr:cytidylate kinase-like family protein [Deltaproteobacteria bacterium]
MAIITISRQVGSLGDEAAAALAEEMGYRQLTAAEVHQVAAGHDPGFAKDLEKLGREGHPGFWEKLLLGWAYYASLYAAVIYELASQDKYIIMGRGAQVVLKDVPGVVRIRVVAPTEVRVARLGQSLGLSPEEARSYLESHDHERRELVRNIFEHDPRDWSLYNLVINSSALDVPGVVALIRQAREELARVNPGKAPVEILAALALGKLVETRVRRKVLPSKLLTARGEPGGVVVVGGYLPSDTDRQKALDLAAQTEGVREVRDEVQVSRLPAYYR